MKTIWKYEIQNTDYQLITAPDNAEILCVQLQHGDPFLWLLVDPNIPVRDYGVKIFGTGHPVNLDDEFKYAGTFQQQGEFLVLHVFVA